MINNLSLKKDYKIYKSTDNDEEEEKVEELIKEEEQKSHPKQSRYARNANPKCYILFRRRLGYQDRCKDCGYIGAFVLEK